MPEICRNIYKNARKAKGYTQESAAERLGISVESMRAYETGLRIPNTDIVKLMATIYDAPYLLMLHLEETNDLYRAVIPSVPQYSLLRTSSMLASRVFAFADSHADRRLMLIAEDNVVSPEERPEFEEIQNDLDEIVQAALAVKIAKGGEA